MIRTRWLVASMLCVVAAIGALVYWDELNRSEAGLFQLGAEQVSLANAAAIAVRTQLAAGHDLQEATSSIAGLERAGHVVILVGRSGGTLQTLDRSHRAPAEIVDAMRRGETIARVARANAPALGLSQRTAMVGLSHFSVAETANPNAAGEWTIAVASSAEGQRDRDREGRARVLLSIVLAISVVTGFGALVWKKQRNELELEHEIAVAHTAHNRDADLERLSRSATMAALGSGVAHELSTPLGVIVGRAEQLLARVGGDERAVKAANTIIEQTEYIDRVVRGLLGLARGAPIALAEVAANDIVAQTVALVSHRFERAGCKLVTHVGVDVPAIRCDSLLLKHALINLLLNACDASPRDSVVELEVHADAAEVAFVVTDAGAGITPADAQRAIEPFFTTKPAGHGTGLGLAIANEIAKTHRGELSIEPRLVDGKVCGTRACIRIPIERAES